MTSIPFEIHTCLDTALSNISDEELVDRVPLHGPQARIWQGTQGLVVPRTYSRNPLFKTCRSSMAESGWPIDIRQSGGGLVPQGPGIWNLSLSWRQYGKPLDLAQAAYPFICGIVQQALQQCSIESAPQAVEGSFCDGRFNLAVWHGQYQKIVGTAQIWRLDTTSNPHPSRPRRPGDPAGWHLGLVHAVILVKVNEKALTLKTNLAEQLLQSSTRYQADKICSLHRLGLEPTVFLQALLHQLAVQPPPHDQGWPLS